MNASYRHPAQVYSSMYRQFKARNQNQCVIPSTLGQSIKAPLLYQKNSTLLICSGILTAINWISKSQYLPSEDHWIKGHKSFIFLHSVWIFFSTIRDGKSQVGNFRKNANEGLVVQKFLHRFWCFVIALPVVTKAFYSFVCRCLTSGPHLIHVLYVVLINADTSASSQITSQSFWNAKNVIS